MPDRKDDPTDGGGRSLGRVLGIVLLFLGLAAAGAAAVVFFLLGGEAASARADVQAIGEEVKAQYVSGHEPFVLFEDGAYSVGTTVLGTSIESPTVAFYPGADSFCVVLTTMSGDSYSYSAAQGPQDGSCAPADTQPFDPSVAGVLTAQASSEYWFGLSIGECVLDDTSIVTNPGAASTGPLTAPTVVQCSEPHLGEVYAVARITPGTAQGDLAFGLHVRELCEGRPFKDYTGVAYIDSEYSYSVLYPTEEAAEYGADEMVCLLTKGEQVTGSARGPSSG